jgi:hypothetical protein
VHYSYIENFGGSGGDFCKFQRVGSDQEPDGSGRQVTRVQPWVEARKSACLWDDDYGLAVLFVFSSIMEWRVSGGLPPFVTPYARSYILKSTPSLLCDRSCRSSTDVSAASIPQNSSECCEPQRCSCHQPLDRWIRKPDGSLSHQGPRPSYSAASRQPSRTEGRHSLHCSKKRFFKGFVKGFLTAAFFWTLWRLCTEPFGQGIAENPMKWYWEGFENGFAEYLGLIRAKTGF